MQARSKLNSMERTISKALIDNEISYKGYTAITDEEKTKSDYQNVEKTKKQYRKK